jgi:cytochrome c553
MKSGLAITLLSLLLPAPAFADIEAGATKSTLCDLCHNAGSHDGGMAPMLEAQPTPYLALQLQAFKEKRRTGGGWTPPPPP